MAASSDSVVAEMADSCLMMQARLVARVLTAMYDDVLRPLGIQASQLNLLVFIARTGPIRRRDLGKLMHLDASTLTRNLRVMETNGWIEDVRAGSDGRGFPVRISKTGEALIARAAPGWRKAQRRASQLLGGAGKATLKDVSFELLSAAS